jgi:hypothetical protein
MRLVHAFSLAWPPFPLTFRGEEYLSSLLLSMVLQHCQTATRGELDSYAIKVNADAMICCAEDGFIEITEQAGGRIFAVVMPEGWALLERLRAEQEKDERLAAEHIMSLKPVNPTRLERNRAANKRAPRTAKDG